MLASYKNKWLFVHIPKTGGSTISDAMWEYADLQGASVYEVNDTSVPLKNCKIDRKYFQHDTAQVIKRKFKLDGHDYNSFYKFAVVRNPWDLVVSTWAYWHKLVAEGDSFPYAKWVCETFKTFEDYVNKNISSGTMNQCDYIYNGNRCQIESTINYTENYNGDKLFDTIATKARLHDNSKDVSTKNINKKPIILINKVAKLENLEKDFTEIFDKIGNINPKSYDKLKKKVNASSHKHYTEYYNKATRKKIAESFARDIKHFGYEFGD